MRSMPLARKLTLILEITSAAALLLASGVLIAQWAYTTRSWMIEDLTALAEVTANNSKSSLDFMDPIDGAEVLAALQARAAIDAACLYDAEGEVFVTWTNPQYGESFSPPDPEPDQHRMEGSHFVLFRTIEQNEVATGTLFLQVDFRPFYQRIQRNVLLALLVILFAILLASRVARRLQRPVIGRIQGVVEMANRIATGALPERMPPGGGDEIGELVQAFNQMVDTTRDVVRQTQTLAQGDYSITVEPRSDEDELGHALIQMTEALKGFHHANARQNWLKTALSELNNRMRGEQDLETLNERILTTLAGSVEAPVGALYLADADGLLVFAAGYAFAPDANAPRRFAPGEGLVGQAASEGRRLVLDDVPDDRCRVRSGMLDLVPRQVVALPLIRESDLIGVMEWGSVAGFTPDQIELLDQATEAIAIAIFSAQSRDRLNQLLHTTQEQSRELQEQQAALRTSNEELEERADLLEKQKQEIHRQNQALENAQLDLERKARELASASRYKSEFLANMSHELRTPLNSMLILSKLLKDNPNGNLTEKQVGFAGTIHQAGTDLLTLINDILDLSKVEAGKLQFHIEPVEVAELRTGFEGIFRHVAEDKGVAFPVTIEPGAPASIHTDRQRVGQILRNLLSNAFKFTAEGAVSVRIYAPTSERGDMAVAFAVSDTGIGIPAAKQSQVFAAFRQADGTTSRDFGGTGLGLSISKALAEELGGDILLESEEGKGSTFTLYLPQTAPQPETDAPPPPEPPGERETERVATPPGAPAEVAASRDSSEAFRLLIIEDDDRFVEEATAIARGLGFDYRVAAGGEEGLAIARAEHPHGILLGLMLAEGGGREALRALKQAPETRTIPVLGVSPMGPDQEAMRLGAVGFLTKPVAPEALRAALEHQQALHEREDKRLLLIEDDDRHAASVTSLLDGLGIKVDAVGTGREARELARREVYDCVILDLGLEDMSGFELLEHVDHDRSGCHVPVIVHTGRDLSREDEARLRRSAESIVLKSAHAAEDLLEKVKLYLHISDAPEAAPSPVPPVRLTASSRPAADLNGHTVLIVDDDMRNAYSLGAAFDQAGLSHLVAPSGEKALDLLAEHADIDLVLMDIMMPGMDGYEATRRIREQPALSDLPIIALTANAMAGDREKCLAAGATDYLPKPVDVPRLLTRMQELL